MACVVRGLVIGPGGFDVFRHIAIFVAQISQIVDVLRQEGVAILLVEQNVPLTLETSERVYFMEKGTVRHHAPASELHADHEVVHKYLGV